MKTSNVNINANVSFGKKHSISIFNILLCAL